MSGYEGLPILMAEAWQEPGDLEAVQKRILEEARKVLQADICTLFPINPITGDFADQPQLAGGLQGQHDLPFDRPRPTGITRKVLEQGELLVKDLDSQPEYESPFSLGEGIKAFAALALKVPSRPKPFAVLYIDYREPRQFDDTYLKKLRQLAREASANLQNAWLFNRYRRVIEIGQEVNRELDTVENLFHLLERHVSQIIDTSYFLMLAIYSEQSQTFDLYSKYQGEFTVQKQHEMTPGCRWVIENCRPLVYNEYSTREFSTEFSTDPRIETLKLVDFNPEDPEDPESLIFLPLLLRGVPFGVLSIQHLNANAYDNEDLHILEILGNHVASALSNIRLFDDLTQLSTTGQLLTGPSEDSKDEDVLEHTVRKIHEATRADLVVLYPYHQERDTFELPPRIRGNLRDTDVAQPEFCQRPDSPYRVVDLGEPAFLDEADSPASLQLLSSRPGEPSDFQKREGIASVAALPLRVGGETVGALYLNYREPQRFYLRQKHLIHGLAVFAAIAIKNAWKFGRHGRELAVLSQIDNKLRRTGSFTELLHTILVEANKIVNADSASILLQDQETGVLKSATHIGPRPRVEGRGITQWVFEHQESVNVANVRTDPKWRDLYVRAIRTTTSELAVPLFDGGKSIGVLNFESPQEKAFGEDDLTFATTLAGQVVLAVKKAQLHEKTLHLANERKVLIDLTKQVVSQLDLQSLLDLILRKAIDATKATAGALFVYDERDKSLVVRSEHGTDQDNHGLRLPISKGVVGRVAQERKIRYIPDLNNSEWKDIFLPYASGIRSMFTVPLLSGGKLWGILNLESRFLNGFKAEDRYLVAAFADVAVVALQNAHSHESARRELSRFEALFKAGLQLAELREGQKGEACKVVTTEAAAQRECRAVVRVYDPLNQELLLVHAAGLWTEGAPKSRKINEGLNSHVFRTRSTYNCGDVKNPRPDEPPCMTWDENTRSLLITPIKFGDTYYGNLALSQLAAYYFDDTDVKLAEGLARLLAITFHRLDFIKEQRELQQAMTMSLIDKAAYSLTHRLGDNLGWIPSYVNLVNDALIAKGFQDHQVDEYLSEISQATSRVQKMSTRLREQAQKLKPVERVKLDIADLFSELLDEFRTKPPSITIATTVQENTGRIYAMRDHPREILIELIKNAIEATPQPQGGTVALQARNSGRHIHIQVSDSGIGIPSEDLEKVFGFLYSTKGGGFGLWSAEQMAILNGGRIKAQSELGRGSTFTLIIPRADQELEVPDAK